LVFEQFFGLLAAHERDGLDEFEANVREGWIVRVSSLEDCRDRLRNVDRAVLESVEVWERPRVYCSDSPFVLLCPPLDGLHNPFNIWPESAHSKSLPLLSLDLPDHFNRESAIPRGSRENVRPNAGDHASREHREFPERHLSFTVLVDALDLALTVVASIQDAPSGFEPREVGIRLIQNLRVPVCAAEENRFSR
jgi:hypothetical protein